MRTPAPTETPASCRQCNSSELLRMGQIPCSHTFAGQRLTPPRHGGELYQCLHCKLGFRFPIRSAEEYEKLYSNAPTGIWVSHKPRHDQLLTKQFIESRLSSGSILDVGCYSGVLLESLGTSFEKFGAEASISAAEVAESKGIKIVAQRFEDLRGLKMTFDAICAIDVIEHVAQPADFTSMLIELLKPNGVLLASTGSIDHPAWRIAGAQYWYCSFPEHISFISEEWGRLFAKSAGIRLENAQSFRYADMHSIKRFRAQCSFLLRMTKQRIAPLLQRIYSPGARDKTMNQIYGHPGIFADHTLLAFSKVS